MYLRSSDPHYQMMGKLRILQDTSRVVKIEKDLGLIYDYKVPTKFKKKFYRIATQSTIFYGSK